MTKPKCQIAFNFFGTIFFIMATAYFGMLLWKSYVWYKWLSEMEKALIRQTPPTSDPLVNPRGRWDVTHWYGPLTKEEKNSI